METFWMIWVLFMVLASCCSVWVLHKLNKQAAERHKVTHAKRQELYDALFATHQELAKTHVIRKEAIEALIDANCHLAPAGWMVGTRRVITSDNFLEHYGEGLKKVDSARKLAGFEVPSHQNSP